ncbi:MAG: hypothetical protein HYT87_03705 [Nitrospirae bacterium]|nr:hypothetical protein [Nitrospirota bacterium]
MVKTLVYLEEDQRLRLLREAKRQGKTVSQLMREAVNLRVPAPIDRKRGMGIVGLFSGGGDNVSERHHEVLGEIFRKKNPHE